MGQDSLLCKCTLSQLSSTFKEPTCQSFRLCKPVPKAVALLASKSKTDRYKGPLQTERAIDKGQMIPMHPKGLVSSPQTLLSRLL